MKTKPARLRRLVTVAGLALALAPLQPADAQDFVARLCQEANCGRLPLMRLPRIESIFLFSNVTPGGYILLKGSGLANTVALTLKLVDFRGNAKAVQVTLVETGATFIGARIPAGVSEVMDQTGTLQARTGANLYSNEFPVSFRAEREMRLLPPHDAVTHLISCGFDSNNDVCNGHVDRSDGSMSGGGKGPSLTTFYGGHYNCWGCVGTDRGTDVYEIRLRNGWVADSMDWHVIEDPGESHASRPVPPSGTSRWRPRIEWYATPNDGVAYTVNLHIVGPKGVPWR